MCVCVCVCVCVCACVCVCVCVTSPLSLNEHSQVLHFGMPVFPPGGFVACAQAAVTVATPKLALLFLSCR